MSPVTHFLTGWVLANCARLDQKERALVTLACVAPDVDGLGIVAELLTRTSSHPLNSVLALPSPLADVGVQPDRRCFGGDNGKAKVENWLPRSP